MKNLNPRIIRRKDGSALLTGVAYSDLCHILTLASLQQYESEKIHRDEREPEAARDAARYRDEQGPQSYMAEIVEENLREERIFHRRIRATLDMLKSITSPRYTGDDGPIHALPRWQAMRRLKEAKDNRAFRHRMREFFSERRSARAETTAEMSPA